MGTWNKKNETYTDSLTGTVHAPVGRKFHLSQMKRTEHGLKKVDDYYLDTGLEIMDVISPSMDQKKKLHNGEVIEKYFENHPPTHSIALPKFRGSGGFEWIIELTDGLEKMIDFSDDEDTDARMPPRE